MSSDSPIRQPLPDARPRPGASPRTAPTGARRRWLLDAVALLWGMAEASLFFLPVEMLITWLALASPLRALRAAALALAGALAGAAALYWWGAYDQFAAPLLVAALPGLSPEFMVQVEETLLQEGLRAVPAGVLSAATGKAHTVQAHALGIGPLAYLAVYTAVRAVRLLLAGCMAFCAGAVLHCFLSRRIVLALWGIAWALVLWRMFG